MEGCQAVSSSSSDEALRPTAAAQPGQLLPRENKHLVCQNSQHQFYSLIHKYTFFVVTVATGLPLLSLKAQASPSSYWLPLYFEEARRHTLCSILRGVREKGAAILIRLPVHPSILLLCSSRHTEDCGSFSNRSLCCSQLGRNTY